MRKILAILYAAALLAAYAPHSALASGPQYVLCTPTATCTTAMGVTTQTGDQSPLAFGKLNFDIQNLWSGAAPSIPANTVLCNSTATSAAPIGCTNLVLGVATGGAETGGSLNVAGGLYVNGSPVPSYPQNSAEALAGFTPTAAEAVYPWGDARRYGMVGDGHYGFSTGTDNTPAFNTAIAVCQQGQALYIPGGLASAGAGAFYRFASKPNAISNGCNIRGSGKALVYFLRDYTESTPTNGFIEAYGGALTIQDVYLIANTGSTGGAAIHLYGTAGGSEPGFSQLIGMYVSGTTVNGGTWSYAIYVDGSQNTTAAAGVRDLKIFDCDFFSATVDIADFITVNNAQIYAGFFTAGGTATGIKVSGVAGNPSNNVIIQSNFLPGLTMDYAQYVQIYASTGISSISNTANVSHSQVMAPNVTGSIQYNWLNSQYLIPNVRMATAGIVSAGTAATIANCGTPTVTGGPSAGQFTAGAMSCNPVITTGLAAPNGWHCRADDETTAITFRETAHSATSATLTASGAATTSDVIDFSCVGF